MKTEIKSIDLPIFKKGKVREVYDLGDNLLMVASDRISAFDHVLPALIPDKGKVLNEISTFWFKKLNHIIANHLITTDVSEYPENLKVYKDQLERRSALVQKTDKIDIECIVRGYLAGTGWIEYQKSQTICGIKLPAGLKESEKLPEPIFTPSTKEEGGKHDENISFERMVEHTGRPLAETLKQKSLEVYKAANAIAAERGFILADTKFEFGMVGGQPILIDEILTPDSSRFWDIKKYEIGRAQDSFDKQVVRDYLLSIKWDKKPPLPSLPDEIIKKTREKYIEAYERLTGETF